VPESGATLRENAALKAMGFARQIAVLEDKGRGGRDKSEAPNPKIETNPKSKIQNPKFRTEELFVLADDSGLEVDALDGAPGVRSARYAGEKATYPELIAKLLRDLKDVPLERRTARFRCCVCLASAQKIVLEAEGACEGRIIFEPRGTGGFGYDPVFVPDGYNQTFAELGAGVKNRLSHRGAAIREFRKRFAEYLDRETHKANG
jgi:XTP/dITP diphosphohydrolase